MKKAAAIASNPTAFQTLLFFLFTLFSSLLCHTLTRFSMRFVQTLIRILSFQKGQKKTPSCTISGTQGVFSLCFIFRQRWISRWFPIHFWWFYHTTLFSVCPFPFLPFYFDYFHFCRFISIIFIFAVLFRLFPFSPFYFHYFHFRRFISIIFIFDALFPFFYYPPVLTIIMKFAIM